MPSNDCVDQCGQVNANSKTLGTIVDCFDWSPYRVALWEENMHAMKVGGFFAEAGLHLSMSLSKVSFGQASVSSHYLIVDHALVNITLQ